MKVLVTGASGFVGSHVAEELARAGHEVRCFVRSEEKLRRTLDGAPPGEVVLGDLGDRAALARAVSGVDAVAHVAGLVAARRAQDLFEVNRDGTARLAEAVRSAAPGLHVFLYLGSLAAAGPAVPGAPLVGDEPARPVTPYGASKAAGEEAARASGLPWRVLRPPAVYGPRDVEFLRMFKAARSGVVPVFGDGSQELSLVQVEDLAAATVAVLERGRDGAVYYPAHPEVTTARAVAGAVGEALGRRRTRVVGVPRLAVRPILAVTGAAAALAGRPTLLSPDKAPEFLAPAWTCSPQRLERDTGWRARHDVAAGMERTARWYREHGWL